MKHALKTRKQLQQQLEQAHDYEHWCEAATALDDLDGLLAWREQEETGMLHESLMRKHMGLMDHCRQNGDTRRLIRILQESLYRHLGELSYPDLYTVARSGTNRLVGEFLDAVETSMEFICDHPIPEVTTARKLKMFQDAERVYGRPALMLSGGAAFGIYHIGVTRALWRQDLLPDVMAGSSMGAIVAGAICTRNDKELAEFFNHPERIHLNAFRWLGVTEGLRAGHAMDPRQLQEHLQHNLGSVSFKEAYEHSGRTLNISVSPTRTQQKPRPLIEQAYAMTSQQYLGDINIHFPPRASLYRKVLSNPTPEDLEMYINLGEQATWPRLAMIKDQTRISRAFDRCIARLEQELEQETAEQTATPL